MASLLNPPPLALPHKKVNSNLRLSAVFSFLFLLFIVDFLFVPSLIQSGFQGIIVVCRG